MQERQRYEYKLAVRRPPCCSCGLFSASLRCFPPRRRRNNINPTISKANSTTPPTAMPAIVPALRLRLFDTSMVGDDDPV